MARHLAVLLVLIGSFYLAIRFVGLPGKYMLVIPALFIIYLGIFVVVSKTKSDSSTKTVSRRKKK